MKLEDARNAYYDYSGTLSNINRQLALSGIAIVWFFIQPKNSLDFNFGAFKCAFIFFSAALFFDLVIMLSLKPHGVFIIVSKKSV